MESVVTTVTVMIADEVSSGVIVTASVPFTWENMWTTMMLLQDATTTLMCSL
jgi:hypothetical protein